MNAVTRSSRWRLKSIKIRSFRGVANEQTYAFEGRPGLLHGNNGVGKSTAAQCVQWTLYGKFPSEVLSNTGQKSFLSPVSAKTEAWSGQVMLQSGDREMVIARDQATKAFTLELDGETFSGPEAEQERDRLLGLDMAGFVRTVLLQQSRIRGLLLDSPKDRNAALDRLLGMDDIENILLRLKPKDFTKAAATHREKILSDQNRHEAKEELLLAKRDEAQRQAREHKFLNKDFSNVGLKSAYASIAEMLRSLATKYEVDLDPLASCSSVKKSTEVSAAVALALRALRTESNLGLRATPINEATSKCTELKNSMVEALANRAEWQELRREWMETQGDEASFNSRRSSAEEALRDAHTALKRADELRQLLADAKLHLEDTPSDSCPLCEQPIGSAEKLISDISVRLDSLTSDEITELQARVESVGETLADIEEALEEYKEQEEGLQIAQDTIDEIRTEAIDALGGQGISEGKVCSRLDSALQDLQSQREDLARGVTAMEDALAKVEQEDRRIRDGLVPVLQARNALVQLEDEWKRTQESHAAVEAAAAKLESTGDELSRLRAALLDAKNELASNTLSQASPRANELYRRLVRHPVFDVLEITTSPKANKIDYSFEVSSAGKKGTAREARLVLSDGQVTATAIGLFFAFSDAETHNLDLLYVDDPTQNLDLPCKEAMAKVVMEIAQKRQVVVSTQDEDFVSFLEAEGFFDIAVVHHLQSWDGNPRVKTKMAS